MIVVQTSKTFSQLFLPHRLCVPTYRHTKPIALEEKNNRQAISLRDFKMAELYLRGYIWAETHPGLANLLPGLKKLD